MHALKVAIAAAFLACIAIGGASAQMTSRYVAYYGDNYSYGYGNSWMSRASRNYSGGGY